MLKLFLIVYLISIGQSETLTKAFLTHSDNITKSFNLGEIFQAELKIFPVKKEELNQFKNIHKLSIVEAIYISDLEEISYEDNIINITATAIFKKYLDPNSIHVWEFNGKKINLQLHNLTVAKSFNNSTEYILYNQKGNLDVKNHIYLVIIIIILIPTIYLIYKKIIANKEEKRKILKRKMIYQKWKEIFLKAKNRDDYEHIYKNKNEWIQFLQNNQILVKSFINSINSCQYKKQWDSDELNNVESSFNKIRRILNG